MGKLFMMRTERCVVAHFRGELNKGTNVPLVNTIDLVYTPGNLVLRQQP